MFCGDRQVSPFQSCPSLSAEVQGVGGRNCILSLCQRIRRFWLSGWRFENYGWDKYSSCNALCRIWIDFLTMGIGVEKLSAVTLKVADMAAAVRFYRDVLGMELLYGGPNSVFSSLRMP